MKSTNQLSKEEVRAARLRAIGIQPVSQQNQLTNMSPAPSYDVEEESHLGIHFSPRHITLAQFNRIKEFMFAGGGATEDDMRRWFNQGFEFCDDPNFGLRQGHGGPCGVLAAVQAEIIKELIFDNEITNRGPNRLPQPRANEVKQCLVSACSRILGRAAGGGRIYIVDCPNLLLSLNSHPQDLVLYELVSEDEARAFFSHRLRLLMSNCGCIALLMSVMLSRWGCLNTMK
jgi:hypothetical protein